MIQLSFDFSDAVEKFPLECVCQKLTKSLWFIPIKCWFSFQLFQYKVASFLNLSIAEWKSFTNHWQNQKISSIWCPSKNLYSNVYIQMWPSANIVCSLWIAQNVATADSLLSNVVLIMSISTSTSSQCSKALLELWDHWSQDVFRL
jgi:hypothetical protein